MNIAGCQLLPNDDDIILDPRTGQSGDHRLTIDEEGRTRFTTTDRANQSTQRLDGFAASTVPILSLDECTLPDGQQSDIIRPVLPTQAIGPAGNQPSDMQWLPRLDRRQFPSNDLGAIRHGHHGVIRIDLDHRRPQRLDIFSDSHTFTWIQGRLETRHGRSGDPRCDHPLDRCNRIAEGEAAVLEGPSGSIQNQ